MSDYLPSVDFLIGGVIVGLILAGFSAFFNRRRLYIIVPKLFSHSELSSSGQVVELNVHNKGTRTEEDIKVSLSPKLNYEVIASTIPGLTISNSGVITIDRLSKSDEVSIVLTVEKGEFSHDSVLSINSKDTKGEIKKKTEDAEELTLGGQIAALSFIFIFMPLAGYLFGNIFVEEVLPNISPKTDANVKLQASLKGSGWSDINNFIEAGIFPANVGSWPIKVGFPQREGSILKFPVSFDNQSTELAEISVYSGSPFDDREYFMENGHWPRDSITGFLVPAESTSERELEVYLPFKAKNKVVRFDFTIEVGSETYRPTYTWVFESD